MKKTRNKGEWSELYTLLKIIDDKNLYAGDNNFNKNLNVFFPVLEVFKGDDLNPTRYEMDFNNGVVNIYTGNSSYTVPIIDFTKHLPILLTKIKEGKGTFAIKEVQNFITQISLQKISSSSKTKKDIAAIINSGNNNFVKLEFSIKSWIGEPPTLLNASQATNFIFAIQGLNPLTNPEIDHINGMKKFYDKLLYLKKRQTRLSFVCVENQIFHDNLTLIDSQLPQILGYLLEDYYSTKGLSKITDLINRLAQADPLHINNKYFYEKKIRDLLSKVALGMFPKIVWDGYNSVSGGHILVCENGELMTYFYIYSRQEFENYLFNTTKLETPSTSRHKFGKIYLDHLTKNHYIKLNLQIRFSTLST
jgi:type II restriction enzyme